MSTERPDEFDEIPSRDRDPDVDRYGPDRDLRDDYRDDQDREHRPPPPPRKKGFGFWMAVIWSLLYFVATQFVAGIVFGIVILGGALAIEAIRNGNDVLKPDKLNAWLQGPTGATATLLVVAATQFSGLALSWLLFRLIVGRSWKRKIALTRGPTLTHFALVVVGMPALLALASVVDIFITRYIPSLQQMLGALGIHLPGLEGTDEMIKGLIDQSPWGLALFVVGVTPAICEEVFCRGFLGWGLSYRYRSWMVVLIVSFLFGCLHGDPRQGLGAMCLGAAIHGSYLATRSLWVPMFVHWANNSVGVVHMHSRLYPVLKPYELILEGSTLSAVLFITTASLLFGAVAYALYQTRCRLVAVDPRPAWQPDNPRGMEVPPPDSGTVVTHDPLSPLSVALILTGAIAFGLVMALA
jgi:membrane protease YdiL (CAAX protease family)